MNNIPLSIALERARLRLVQSFNQIIADSKLPAYLYEGIILDILSETRKRKNLELVADMNIYQEQVEAEQSGTDGTNVDETK